MHRLYSPKFLLVCFSILFVSFFYGDILFAPNEHVFASGGDGLKNYFTYAYHIKHDTSATHFGGMNYPYGESYLYTDCHPILSSSFRSLGSGFTFFKTHSIGILNLILLTSLLLGFPLMYALLRAYKIEPWLSFFFSISIVLLAPHLHRLLGHLALSYSIAVPLTWLLWLKFNKHKNLKIGLLLMANNLFWLFIHAYLGLIALAFTICMHVLKIIADTNRTQRLRHHGTVLLILLIPIVFFYGYNLLIDTHVDRTLNPSGFFLYNAEIDDLLLPYDAPFRPLLDDISGGTINLEWEARGYLGFSNVLLLLSIVILSLTAIFRSRFKGVVATFFGDKSLNVALLSATVVLLFAFGIPFKQFPALLDWLPTIKQFRATGRFVWPFYFAFSVFAAVSFQIIIRKLNQLNRMRALVFAASVIGVLLIEGFVVHIHFAERISNRNNPFQQALLSKDLKKAINAIDAAQFQAIIGLPFYHVGSEVYTRPIDPKISRQTILISYHTGLPNVGSSLGRTSISESKKIIQMLGPNYYEKPIQEDLNDPRPFLLIRSDSPLSKYENTLISKATSLGKFGKIEILSIEKGALFSSSTGGVQNQFAQLQPGLKSQNGFYVTDSATVLYYDNFDSNESAHPFRGAGGFQSEKRGDNTIATFNPMTFQAEKEYSISMWMHNAQPDALNEWFRFIVAEYDASSDQWHNTVIFPDQAEVINGDWSLVEGRFTVRDAKNEIRILTKGPTRSKAQFYADDLLIHDAGIDVYKPRASQDILFYNNHEVR